MSSKFSLIKYWYRLVVFTGLGLIVFSGCRSFEGSKDFYGLQIPPEKFRQIEPLDLHEAGDQETDRTDANEPAPAELELAL